MQTRRHFISSLAAIGFVSSIGHPVGISTNNFYKTQNIDPELKNYLSCQWVGAFDDPKEIDDSKNDFPLWKGEAGPDSDDLRSCLAAVGYYAVGSALAKADLDGRLHDVIKAVKNKAMNILKAGQTHHPSAQQAYENAKMIMGEDAFWLFVIRTGETPLPSQLDQAKQNAKDAVEWASQNNHKSLVRSSIEWNTRGNPAKAINILKAGYYLYLGQRHNRDAVRAYRNLNTNDEHAELLFAMVNKFAANPGSA